MAIQKAESWPYGGTAPTANYHSINNPLYSKAEACVYVSIFGWYNKAAYDAGDDFYIERRYCLLLADHSDLSDIVLGDGGSATDYVTEMYVAIKATTGDEYAGFFNTGTSDV